MRAVSSSRRSAVSRAATAIAAIPATFCVPLRRSRSWPPPTWRAASRTPGRTTRAPTPFGPPNLWALTDTRSAPAAALATSSHDRAWTASVCSSGPGRPLPHQVGDLVERAGRCRPRC